MSTATRFAQGYGYRTVNPFTGLAQPPEGEEGALLTTQRPGMAGSLAVDALGSGLFGAVIGGLVHPKIWKGATNGAIYGGGISLFTNGLFLTFRGLPLWGILATAGGVGLFYWGYRRR